MEILDEAVASTMNGSFHDFHRSFGRLRVQLGQGHQSIGLEEETPSVRVIVEHRLKYTRKKVWFDEHQRRS